MRRDTGSLAKGKRRGQKDPPSLNLLHISYSDEAWHTYTLTNNTFTLMQSFGDSSTFAVHMNLQKLTGVPRSSKFSCVHIYYDIKSCSLIATMIYYYWKLKVKKGGGGLFGPPSWIGLSICPKQALRFFPQK